ncbi:sensor histidine kinase [Larkinella punicea]|uniref:histidine kinase n=1 Tax=Larkinella punicea TaxID=2315727 RepID=A0A368JII2_9BACT|nr:HAMP domain-containing sensor histidine kinase [Larkinella punicea]RCR67469.1 sensor histidine kinase [Larkinella punicea]
MRLLTLTTRYYLVLFLLILAVWSLVLYAVLRQQVYQNIDEILFNRKQQISVLLNQPQRSLPTGDPYTDFKLRPLPPGHVFQPDQYADTLVFEPVDQEYDEYRQLRTQVRVSGNPYELTIVKPRLESTEMINTVSITLPTLFLVLGVGLALTARRLNRILWQPFYRMLHQLGKFRVDQTTSFQTEPTSIDEFSQLQQGLTDLTERNRKLFMQQKQFIENASHEMQTPLAVIQSHIEVLLQQAELDYRQAEPLESILTQTERLGRLNQALLLLSKIENNQFRERTPVPLKPLVEGMLPYFEEQIEQQALRVELTIPADTTLHTHPVLAEILLTNLLKNAFVHNLSNGFVRVDVKGQTLTVENTGDAPDVPTDQLFERFRKASRQKQTLGLGLAIVKTIADVNGWAVTYQFANGIHRLTVTYA